MKKIWYQLKWHVINDFHPVVYGAVAVFLAISIALNYYFDFDDSVMSQLPGMTGFLGYCLFFAVPYYFTVAVNAVVRKQGFIFKQRSFWSRTGFFLAVLALDASLPYLRLLVNMVFHPAAQYWALKVAVNGVSFFTVVLPVLIFYYLHDRDQGHRYGLNTKQFNARPYLLMLAIVLPLLVGASFHESFLRQYPMYKVTGAHVQLGVDEWVTVAAYELAYGLDFVTVELIFRGFMILGMASLLGRGAVLPMAAAYCFLHFGKPPAEAISSIFGGYVLGVIALETRSIWGGVIVHMGVAWLMEILAFVQKNLS